MKANLVRTEPFLNKTCYIYACTKCGAEFSRMQCHDRINELCGKCKTEVDRQRNKELAEIRQAKHDAEVRNKAIDEYYSKLDCLIKSDSKQTYYYTEFCRFIMEVKEQLKGGE